MTETIHLKGDQWYFWDEVGFHEYGPYPIKEIAREELDRYCEEELGFGDDEWST